MRVERRPTNGASAESKSFVCSLALLLACALHTSLLDRSQHRMSQDYKVCGSTSFIGCPRFYDMKCHQPRIMVSARGVEFHLKQSARTLVSQAVNTTAATRRAGTIPRRGVELHQS